MATVDEIQAQRDAAIRERDQTQQSLTQGQNAYAESAGRPNEFQTTFKDRVRSRFNKRSAANQQLQGAITSAGSAGVESLNETAGSGMSAMGRAAASSRAAAFANQGVLDAQESVGSKITSVQDIANAVVAGIEAERAKKAEGLNALSSTFNMQTQRVGELSNDLSSAQGGGGGSSTPRTAVEIPGYGTVNMTNSELLSYIGGQGGVEPLYDTEPIYEEVPNYDPLTGAQSGTKQVKVGERQFFIDPATKVKTYVSEQATPESQPAQVSGGGLGGWLGGVLNTFKGFGKSNADNPSSVDYYL